jgi:hypothetical protein
MCSSQDSAPHLMICNDLSTRESLLRPVAPLPNVCDPDPYFPSYNATTMSSFLPPDHPYGVVHVDSSNVSRPSLSAILRYGNTIFVI